MPAIWLFPAVGTPSRVTVRGRAFHADPDRGSTALSRNVRSIFLAREHPHADVILHVLGAAIEAKADAEGFFSCAVPADTRLVPLGEHVVTAGYPGQAPCGQGRLFVVPDQGISLVSDLDDTIAHTHVAARGRMVETALLRDHSDHEIVPGMAALYRALARGAVSAFHYLSGSPVGMLQRTIRLLERHGFPPGSIGLRHYETEPFDPLAYKSPRLLALAEALPGHRFVLVGDDGERDPEAYARLRVALGERVAAVWIRRVGGGSLADPRLAGCVAFDRPSRLAGEAVRLGWIDAGSVADVVRAEA